MSHTHTRHPVLRAAATMDAALASVADVNAVFMSIEDKAAALCELAALESRLAELRLRVMAAADDVAARDGAADVGSWVATATRARLEEARTEDRLATALDRDHDTTARALRQGSVSLAQAQVIVRALDALPDDLGSDTRDEAERFLVTQAAELGPRQLTVLGRRVLDVVAPDIAEATEARRLADLELHAREKTRLTLRRQGDGTTRISGRISDGAASRLATYLYAFTNPRKAGATDSDQPGSEATTDPVARLPYPRRLGDAFTQLLEVMDTARLPLHGGDATTVIVTIGLEQLRSDLAAGDVIMARVPGEGEPDHALSAAEVRRLACQAHLIPAVLGGRSEILDLGRRQRLFTAAQRRALLLRDTTCRAEGCDIPGTWSEAHHWIPWSTGGPTDLDNATLLCSHHHHRAHDPTYDTDRHPNGDIRFHRRR